MALGMLSVSALLLAACHPGAPGDKGSVVPPPSPYATISNGKLDIEGGIVWVAAEPGRDQEVMVQEGDTVRKGQILAQEGSTATATAQGTSGQAQVSWP
jgi:HlyD family secretion protein